MKITKTTAILSSFCALSLSGYAATIIDSTFANGNGSFEFDSAGIEGTAASPAFFNPGKWVTTTAASYTIDGTGSFFGVNDVRSLDTAGASNGSHGLQLRAGPYANGGSYGGLQNTGYVVGASDDFTFSFDWTIVNNQLGATNVEVYLFTSSDNTLDGTLTSLARTTIAQGGAVTGFQTVSLSTGDSNISVQAPNIGQQLWVSFTQDGFSANGLNEIFVVDNVNLSVIPEPSSSALLAIALGGLAFCRRRA